MKQTNGWSKTNPKPGMGRGAKRNNGGSYSLKYHSRQYQNRPKNMNFFETIKDRLSHSLKSLAGKMVELKKSNGLVVEGILIASNNESIAGTKVTIQYVKVKEKPKGFKEDLPVGVNKYIVPWNELVYIYGASTVEAPTTSKEIKTDSDISRRNIMAGEISGRTLKAADSSWVKNSTKVKMDSKEKPRAWDQFKVNEEKFGVKGSYNENLYTSTLDKSTLTPEQIARARKTAKEIENKSSNNLHVKEERNQKITTTQDEESRYSAVARPSNPSIKPKAEPEVQTTSKPLNFAAALMKGKLEQKALSKKQAVNDRFKTPTKKAAYSKQRKNQQTSKNDSPGDSHQKSAKYKVSNVDFAALKKAAQVKREIHTPSSKNWEAHNFTKKKIEAGKGKSREEQIKEFKRFSSSLSSKGKEGKALNVNAKEFKPPSIVAPVYIPVVDQKDAGQSGIDQNQPKAHRQGQGPAPNGAPPVLVGGAPAPGQNYIPQQNVWQMPVGVGQMPQGVQPVHFFNPVMMPHGQHVPVYPQAGNANPIMMPPGQPYFVHMMPPGNMHPYPQQRFTNFPQAPQMVQIAPNQQQQQQPSGETQEQDHQKNQKQQQKPSTDQTKPQPQG